MSTDTEFWITMDEHDAVNRTHVAEVPGGLLFRYAQTYDDLAGVGLVFVPCELHLVRAFLKKWAPEEPA